MPKVQTRRPIMNATPWNGQITLQSGITSRGYKPSVEWRGHSRIKMDPYTPGVEGNFIRGMDPYPWNGGQFAEASNLIPGTGLIPGRDKFNSTNQITSKVTDPPQQNIYPICFTEEEHWPVTCLPSLLPLIVRKAS